MSWQPQILASVNGAIHVYIQKLKSHPDHVPLTQVHGLLKGLSILYNLYLIWHEVFNLPAAPPQGKLSITLNELSVLCMNMLVQDMPFVDTDEIPKQGTPPNLQTQGSLKRHLKNGFSIRHPL